MNTRAHTRLYHARLLGIIAIFATLMASKGNAQAPTSVNGCDFTEAPTDSSDYFTFHINDSGNGVASYTDTVDGYGTFTDTTFVYTRVSSTSATLKFTYSVNATDVYYLTFETSTTGTYSLVSNGQLSPYPGSFTLIARNSAISAPAAPTGLTANPSTGEITLSWNASTGATSYTIYRSTASSGPFNSVGTALGTSFSDTGLAASTTYYYQVSATNSAGTSPKSAAQSAKTPAATTYTLTVVTPINGTVTLNPNKTTGFAYADSQTLTAVPDPGYQFTSWSFTNISGPATYTINPLTTSYISNATVSVTFTAISPSAPAAPTGLTAKASTGEITLSWNASTGATSYTIYRSTSKTGPFNSTDSVTTVTNTGYVDSGLAAGTTYYYEVSATNSAGPSPNSATQSATTPAGAVPAAPTNLSYISSAGQITVSWTASSGATSYTVYRANSASGPFTTELGTSITNSYIDTTVAAGATYYYQVSASNGSETSANSATLTAIAQQPASTKPSFSGGQPSNQTITSGNTASFTATATGTAPVALQWYGSFDGGNTWQELVDGQVYSGTSTGTLTITGAPTGWSGFEYECKATNSAGTTTSNVVTLTINAATGAPIITIQPTAPPVAPGASVDLSVGTSGSGSGLTYQWYYGSSGDTSQPIIGKTSYTFTTPNLVATTSYWVQVTNSAGQSTNSATVTVTVGALGVVLNASQVVVSPNSIQAGTSLGEITFNVLNSGTVEFDNNGSNYGVFLFFGRVPTLDASQYVAYIDNWSNLTLAPNKTWYSSIDASGDIIPASTPPGTYYLIVLLNAPNGDLGVRMAYTPFQVTPAQGASPSIKVGTTQTNGNSAYETSINNVTAAINKDHMKVMYHSDSISTILDASESGVDDYTPSYAVPGSEQSRIASPGISGRRFRASTNAQSYSLSAQLINGVLVGTIDGPGTSVAFTAQPDITGPVASLTGFYTASSLDNNTNVYVIVGASGKAYVVESNQAGMSAVTEATVDTYGNLSTTTSSGDLISLSLSNQTVTGSLVPEGSTTSVPFTGLPEGVTSNAYLLNLSARAFVQGGQSLLIGGFVTGGMGSETYLIRGIGPGLGNFGVTNFLPDPQLVLINGSQSTLASATSWSPGLASTFSQVGAFALTPGSKDAAVAAAVGPGAYTAQISSSTTNTGVALAEIYDTGGGASHLVNISARALIGNGANILIGGFVIGGTTDATLLVRGIGPTLGTFGISSPLASPILSVYDSSSNLVASNSTGWTTQPGLGSGAVLAGPNATVVQPATPSIFSQVGAFQLPSGSADSAMVLTLPPGAYTAQVSGANGSTGVALVEVYQVQ